MRLTDLASPPELSLLLGVSGAAAVVVFGDASLPSLITGSALGLAAVAGAWSARRGRSRSVQAMASHVAQLQQFSDALAPVWSAQIESSRRQMEDAVTSLAERFAQISSRLDQTLALSTGTQGHGSAERVSARSQQELDAVVRLLRASLESKAELVTRVQGLVRFLDELQEMARAIGQITQQTNLLAINATIEAAHAGQFGRGFATVAQEVRLLSKQSGETGDRIAEKISMIGAEIAATCAAAEASATRERDAIGVSEGTINAVLAGFSEFADTLTGTTERLRHESEGIKGEVNEALVQLQFQDRISQVMNHVSTNIDRLPQTMRSYGEECVEAGRLQPLVAAELLAELERTYAMAEERTTHQQPRLAPAAASANDANITFF